MPSIDVEKIKEANPIQDVIAETEPLRGERGRYARAQKHDSLIVDTQGQYYTWNSKNETGDVIDWLVRYRQANDFKGAVEWLCRRGGLPAPEWNGDGGAERIAARAREDALTVYARWAVMQLRGSEQAQAYARGRGWTDETIREAGLGFSGDAKARKDLLGEFSMHGIDAQSDGARAVLAIPAGMLVYPHVRGGRVRYVSARGIAEKRHYNITEEHGGPRQPYANHLYAPGCDAVVVVEGQADAVTCGQWGLAALALAGTALSAELVRALQNHRLVYWGSDADDAGRKAREQAQAIGPLTRLITWPAHDANDWLREANPDAQAVRDVLKASPTMVEWMCEQAGTAESDERDDAILAAMRMVAQLPADKIETRKDVLIQLLGIKRSAFNALLKTLTEEAEGEAETEAEDESLAIEVTGAMVIDDHFVDVLYDAKRDVFALAVRYPDGRIEKRDDFEWRGLTYQPSAHPYILKEIKQPANSKEPPAILMPSDLPERDRTIADLHKAVCDFSMDYLDVPENDRMIAAYYVLFTWLHDCFRDTGYLRAMGPWGKGKSRYVSTWGSICYRALFMLGLSTLSPMFRIRSLTLSTLVLDEINGPFVESPAELEMYFNAGMSARSPRVWRTEGKDAIPSSFSGAYGPKIFGSIKPFRDPATNSRCITTQLTTPTARTDIRAQDGEFDRRAQALRNDLMRFRLKYWREEYALKKWDDPAIEPRLRQITEPLLTIIGEDEKARQELIAIIRAQNAEMIGERSESITAKIVQALAEMAAVPAKAGKQGRLYRDARLKTVYERVRELVFDEEEAPPAVKADGSTDNDSPRNDKKHWINRYYSPRKIGEMVRRDLGLATVEASWAAGKGRAVDLMSESELAKLERLKAVYQVTVEPAAPAAPTPMESAASEESDAYLEGVSE